VRRSCGGFHTVRHSILGTSRPSAQGSERKKPRPGFPGRGWQCRRDRLFSYLVVSYLTELQWLNDDGLLVVAEAAAEAERSRNDDRESDEHAHGWIPQKFPAESTVDEILIAQPAAGCCALHVTVAVFRR
jgi:hypothetical protein